MSIEVHCEACGARFAAPERSAGKSGKCPQCGAPIVVPQPDAQASQPPAPVEEPLADLLDEEFSVDEPPAPVGEIDVGAVKRGARRGSALLDMSSDAAVSGQAFDRPRRRSYRRSAPDPDSVAMTICFWIACSISALALFCAIWLARLDDVWFIGLARICLTTAGMCSIFGGMIGVGLAFSENVREGLLTVFVPFYWFYYVFTRWRYGRNAFMLWLSGLGLTVAIYVFVFVSGVLSEYEEMVRRSRRAESGTDRPRASQSQRVQPPRVQRPGRPSVPSRGPVSKPLPPLFSLSHHRLTRFPDLPPLRVIEPGVLFAEVDLGVAEGVPGQADKLYVYLPAGDHRPKSLPCILIAPAGTNLLTGIALSEDDRPEHLPYVRAGFAVVAYELDGPLDGESAEELRRAYEAFREAGAGMINARNAAEYVFTKVHQVDPDRLYAAGHSSAGTVALLLAAHNSEIAACVAYAAAPDVRQFHAQTLADLEQELPGFDDFARRASPIEHAARIRCPVLLFHSQADRVAHVSESKLMADALRGAGSRPTLQLASRGDHYNSMIDEGIPFAIDWLDGLPGPSRPTGVAALPQAVDAPAAVADPVPWTVKLDPVAAPPVALGAKPVPLRSSRAELVRIVFSSPEAGRAVALNQDRVGGANAAIWLDVCDLAAAQHVDRIGLSSKCKLHATNPGGTLVLLTAGTQAQVWSIADRKPVASWKYTNDSQGEAEWARFGDDDHVAILGRNGDLVFWQVSEYRKLFSLGRVECATMTPGGQYVVALIPRMAALGGHVCDARSGELRGSLKPPSLASWQPEICAPKPDGTLLAAIGRNRLVVWNMGSGELVGEADRAPTGRTLHFVGNNLLLIDGQILHPGTGRVTWRYQIDGMAGVLDWQKLHGSPDGRPWIMVSRSVQDPVYLVPLDAADAAARAALAAAGRPVVRGMTRITADAVLGPAGGAPAVPVGPLVGVEGAAPDGVQKQIREVYVDLIAGDPAGLAERLRWHPGEREPSVGLRWGVGVQWTGEDAGQEIRSEQQFTQATGNVGPGIVAALKQRLAQGKFGDWPAASGSQIDHVVFLGSDDLANLLDDARRIALDRLVLINLTVKTIGFQRRRDVTMVVRLVDVASGQSQWASPSLSASQMMAAARAGGNPGAAMVAEVMKEIDAKHQLAPMPALRPEHVESRVAAMAGGLSDKPDEMLPVLVELRYYQAKGLLPAERAAELYDRILGTGRGRLLAGDDEAERREALSAWLAP